MSTEAVFPPDSACGFAVGCNYWASHALLQNGGPLQNEAGVDDAMMGRVARAFGAGTLEGDVLSLPANDGAVLELLP